MIIGKFVRLIAHVFAGIAVGHVYYFLEDVFPEQPGGFRILKTPGIMWEYKKRVVETYYKYPSFQFAMWQN